MSALATHIAIPDTQVRPGVRTDHLGWIGQYIVDRFAGQDNIKIVHLGDHADMPSLSSYDKGTAKMTGRTFLEDINAANAGFSVLNAALYAHNERLSRNKKAMWQPDLHILLGNHEDRINRAVNADPTLEGTLSTNKLSYAAWGWTVHPFLEVLVLDGVAYSHYFYNPNSGRPYTGMAETRLRTIGHSFTQGHQQGLQQAQRSFLGRRQRALIAGSCLTPDHRVLTADLRYIALSDLKVGDELVSFDETTEESVGRSRRYKTGRIEALRYDEDEVFRVTLSDGKDFKVTADHLWLAKTGSLYRWARTDQLRVGTRMVKCLSEWDVRGGYDAGYLAGMLDGEGCYYTRQTSTGTVAQLTVSQKPGPVLDQTRALFESLCGVDGLTHTNSRGVASMRVRGGAANIARVLGMLRPVRLLAKFKPEHLGRVTTVDDDNPSVVSIEPLGRQTIVRVDVDAKTMVVEGYAHHNCYLHAEDYRGPQAADEWRGILICHEVQDGNYDLGEISLDYLCRRYEGVSLAEFLR